MPVTTVNLPEGLVEQAKAATGEKTAKGAIVTALNEVIVRARQLDAIDRLAQREHLGDLLDGDVQAKAAG